MKESIPLTWRRIPERYRMVGVKCNNCNDSFFPKRPVCPNCRRKGELEEVEFSGEGEVHSFTEIHAPPEGFEDQTPYTIAVIKLKEGPKLTGQIVDSNQEEINIGDEVEQVFRVIQQDDPEGLVHYGFKFKLAE